MSKYPRRKFPLDQNKPFKQQKIRDKATDAEIISNSNEPALAVPTRIDVTNEKISEWSGKGTDAIKLQMKELFNELFILRQAYRHASRIEALKTAKLEQISNEEMVQIWREHKQAEETKKIQKEVTKTIVMRKNNGKIVPRVETPKADAMLDEIMRKRFAQKTDNEIIREK